MTDTSKEAAAKWAHDLRCRAFAYKTDIDIAKHIEALSTELEAAKAQLATARDALATLIYEVTHLSPERDDGSHDCRISKEALAKARSAIKSSPARDDTQEKPHD